MSDSITRTQSQPTIGEHHLLGGVRTVMMLARHSRTDELVTIPLRAHERRADDQWVFELADPAWLELIDFQFQRICLTGQVQERFVTIDADIVAIDDNHRLIVQARSQTFWDVPSGRVFRVASGMRRPRIPFQEAQKLSAVTE